MGEIMNSTSGVKSGVAEHFLPQMWHPSRLISQPYVTVGEQTLKHIQRKSQICTQGLYDDHIIS